MTSNTAALDAMKTVSELNAFWFMLGFTVGVVFIVLILKLKIDTMENKVKINPPL